LGYISGYGATNQQPLGVIIDLISNEATHNLSVSDSQAAVKGWIGAYLAAAPSAKVVGVVPFSLQAPSVFSQNYVTALENGFAYYGSNPKVSLINLGAPLAKTLGIAGSPYLSDGSYHFTPAGHGLIAGEVSPLIQSALGLLGTASLQFQDRFH